MKPGDFRVCPSCQARNKPNWEFCVRCGESLAETTLVNQKAAGARAAGKAAAKVAAKAPAAKGPGGKKGKASIVVHHEEERRAGAGLWVGVILALVAVGAIAAYTMRFRVGSPPSEDNAFVMPTVPQVPVAAKVAADPAPPDSPLQRRLAMARSLLERGDTVGALAALKAILAENPNDAQAHHLYADTLWLTSRTREEALGHYRDAARLAPQNAAYRIDVARALGTLGQPAEAMDQYEAVLRLDPANVTALRELAGFHFRAGDLKTAAPLLARASELAPNDVGLLTELGSALENSGDRAGAIRAYRAAVEKDPAAVATRGSLAELLFREGQQAEAVALVKEGVERDPSIPAFHRDLASFLERSGSIAEAAAQYREYTRLAPDAPDAKSLAERAAALEEKAAASAS